MTFYDQALSISLDHASARIFWPMYGKRPFETCVVCQKSLFDASEPYLIERAFRIEEPIFEYAMCWACRQKCGQGISPKSTQRIVAHIEEHVDFEARAERLIDVGSENVAPWLQRCLLTKADRSECRDYQITALAYQDRLLLGGMPLLISSEAAEQLQRLFSKQTREAMDDFTEQFLGMPPEFRNAPTLF